MVIDYNFKIVEENKKYNFTDKDGKLLSEIWFDGVSEFFEKPMHTIVELNDKGQNFLSKTGKLVSEIWYNHVEPFTDGLAPVHVWRSIRCYF